MIRIAVALVCMVLAAPAWAESDKMRAYRIAEALTQIEWAANNCEGLSIDPKRSEWMLRKVAEAGYMNADFGGREIDKRAKIHGVQTVCLAFLKLYGPNGSVLKGALVMKEAEELRAESEIPITGPLVFPPVVPSTIVPKP